MTKHHITIGKRRFVMQKASKEQPPRTADGTPARWTIYELLPTTESGNEHSLLGHAITLLEAKGVLEQAVASILLRKGERAKGRWGETN
jgi:hypothetical protein